MLLDILLNVLVVWVIIEAGYFLLKWFKVLPKLNIRDDITSNGYNNGIGITMNRATMLSNPNAQGIVAQEYREYYHYPLLIIELLSFIIPYLQRDMEYKGHALEIVWGDIHIEGFDKEKYRKLEALAMSRKYKQFKGIPLKEIIEKLKHYEHDAYNYMSKHKNNIKRVYAELEHLV